MNSQFSFGCRTNNTLSIDREKIIIVWKISVGSFARRMDYSVQYIKVDIKYDFIDQHNEHHVSDVSRSAFESFA